MTRNGTTISSDLLDGRFIAQLLHDRIVALRQDWALGETDHPETPEVPDEDEIPDAAVQIYDLFAVSGGLRRLEDELLRGCIPEEDYEWVLSHLPGPEVDLDQDATGLPCEEEVAKEMDTDRRRLRAWVSMALSMLPEWAAWREAAQVLEDSYELDWAPEERAALARRLLSDLDDAELVCDQVDSLLDVETLPEQELGLMEETLGQVEFVCERAHLFVAAGAYAKAVLDSIKRDEELPEETAEKFEAVCEAVEEAREVCLLSPSPPSDKAALHAVREMAAKAAAARTTQSERKKESPAAARIFGRPEISFDSAPSVAAAATSQETKPPREGPLVELVGEAGWTASLRLPGPDEMAEDAVVKIWIRRLPPPLTRVFLCGLEAKPQKKGDDIWVAEYRIGDLKQVWGKKLLPTLVLETAPGETVLGALRDEGPEE